ncbi:MAG: four-carbon acid sugar kinase family protein [Verrucomicrobiota bacterium]
MIGVIADDLTGAAEIGAIGWRHGLRAEIIRDGKPSGAADLVCVDTDSRSCVPIVAAERAAAAAKMLHAGGARLIYKKVDSALRGNVTPEVEAILKQLGLNRALLLPVNPSLGRTIVDGEYFIHGKPIHLTEFANDPEHPRSSPEVLKLLDTPSHFTLRLSGDERTVPENTLLVAQADSSEQVESWAAACDASCLPIGGSEFFGALLGSESHSPPTEPIDFSLGRQLFICGTASGSVQALVEASREAQVPVFGLPDELATGAEFSNESCDFISQQITDAFETHRRVVLHVGLPVVRDATASRRLADHLVDIAEQVLQSVPVTSVFAEGGATAAELVRRMNWPRLDVRYEWAPGVATLAIADKDTQWLTIKPGSYSWPDEWMRGW